MVWKSWFLHSSILGAYDPTFRKQLKVTYPWAYAALDLALGKEQEEDSILDEKEIAKKASIFKEEFVNTKKLWIENILISI